MNDCQKTRKLHKCRSGLSLMEMAVVVLLLGIAAAVIIPRFEPSVAGQLLASAEIVAADMNYVRSLAVSNNSSYRVTFDKDRNEYAIEHSGANPTLDTLPQTTAFKRDSGGAKYTARLGDSPTLGLRTHVLGVESGEPAVMTDTLDYDTLGAPTPPGDCDIWLTAGQGSGRLYLPVKVHAATGLATIGEITAAAPAAVKNVVAEVAELE